MTAKLYEIWCEGDPRRDFTACHLGYGKGDNLLEAIEDLCSRYEYFSDNYNPYTISYKDCSLFATEAEARVAYG